MSIKDRDGLRAVVESLVATANEMNVNNEGGEEFGVILTNTVLRAALTVSDHVRRAVMSKEL